MRGTSRPVAAAARCLVTICAGGAVYGASIGAVKNATYAWRSAVKVPLLLLGTALLCGLANLVIARALGLRVSSRVVAASSFGTYRAAAMLLASLSPVALFLARTSTPPDERSLGGYPGFVAINMLFVATAATLALRGQQRALIGVGLPAARVRRFVLLWLLLSVAVGGQLAFYLRPFFGIASLVGDPPFLLGDEPTVTGARNFFEFVWQFVVPPELGDYTRRGR